MITIQEFEGLAAAGYSRIPLQRTILADLDTPLSVYSKLANGPYSYLFESVEGGEKWGRYSIIGLPAKRIIQIHGDQIEVLEQGRCLEKQQHDDPLTWISQYQQNLRIPEVAGLPEFSGGLVGYFGYDTVRYVEPKLANKQPEDTLHTPDILLMVSEEVVVFDNLNGHLHFISYVDPSKADAYWLAQQRLDDLIERLRQHDLPIQDIDVKHLAEHNDADSDATIQESDFISGFKQDDYKQAVQRIKDYIVAGDAMQVVLSQRLSIPINASPLNIYRVLRNLNPSPYLYYMDLGDFHIVGASPEILVRLKQGEITVRPIAGTRPRGQDVAEDLALEQDLLADPKELAEHLMLIDLGRNDVGRVAKTGSVKLTEKMCVERYSHVMHIVSNVTGQLDEKHSCMDVLRAAFPAGTLSGAPKIRAMQIIDELEPVKRGVYGGAVGYLSWHGDMDTAIAIRTAVIKDDMLHIQAGAGIVADSDPEMEWQETMNKARAIFKAVAKAERAQTEADNWMGGA